MDETGTLSLEDDEGLQALLDNSLVRGGGDIGIVNEGLDFHQLQEYIDNDEEDPDMYFGNAFSGSQDILQKHSTIVSVNCGPPTGGNVMGNLHNSNVTSYPTKHNLPDSPPDSGSEPPFSPQDHATSSPHRRLNHVPDMLISSGYQPGPVYQNPLANPSNNSTVSSTSKSRMVQPLQFGSGGGGALYPLTPPSQNIINNQGIMKVKKRKMDESLTIGLPVKQEPDLSPDSTNTPSHNDEELLLEYTSQDSSKYLEPMYQCIRFRNFEEDSWCAICNQNLEEVPVRLFRVDADKGFNFIASDEAFVCQKKNHFQITCHIQLSGEPNFIKTPHGLKKIDNFFLHFFGSKVESPKQKIRVEQSQSDRSKKQFYPVLVKLEELKVFKITVGRLHFSETTSNNMRKKGKPNPDQRYFQLVVSLQAQVADQSYPIISKASEKIIVRASNPGQFENDVDMTWQKGQTPDVVYHTGRVGINTDRPDESLVVNGNVRVAGNLYQPSDRRVKDVVHELDTSEQLRNVQAMRVVKYYYDRGFSSHVGLPEESRTGLVAQEVQSVLPDAVKPTEDVRLPDGRHIDQLLVVNKDRVFLENLGAVKELCKVTGNLENRIEELERVHKRLTRLKRLDSVKSNSSRSSVSTVTSRASSVATRRSNQRKKQQQYNSDNMCSNQSVQITIISLVVVMTVCLISMAVLYFMEYHKRNTGRIFESKISADYPTEPTFLDFNSSTKISHFSSINSFSTSDTSTLPFQSSNPPTLPTLQYPDIGKPAQCKTSSTSCQVCCCGPANPSSSSIYHNAQMTRIEPVSDVTLSNIIDDEVTGSKNHIAGVSHTTRMSNTTTTILDLAAPNNVGHLIDDDSQTNDVGNTENMINNRENDVGSGDNSQNSVVQTAINNNLGDQPDSENRFTSEDEIFSGRQTVNKRRRRKRYTGSINNNPGFHLNVHLIELNMTLSADYCDHESITYEDCRHGTARNVTYLVPISKYMCHDSLNVSIFSNNLTSLNKELARCCPSPIEPVSCQADVPNHTSNTSPFMLPVGSFMSGWLRIRVPLTDLQGQEICDLTELSVGKKFVEVNLHYYRVCD